MGTGGGGRRPPGTAGSGYANPMPYSAEGIQILPFAKRLPQADGSFLQQWDLALEQDPPPEAASAGPELLAAAVVELAVVLRDQGYADMIPTEEELGPFDVQVQVLGGSRIRLQLRLLDGRGNLALALTAQVWRAVERRFSPIRTIEGVDRHAWRLYLGPPPTSP